MNHNNLGDMFAHLSPEERLLLSYSLRSPMSAGSSFVQTSAALNSELFRAHAAPADRIALPTSWQGSNSLLNHLPPTPSMLASALVPPMQLSTEALHRTLLARGALNLPFPGLASESLSSQTDALLLQPHQRDLLNRELTKAAFMLRRDPQLMSFPVQTLPPLAALGEPGPVLGSASSAGKTKTVQSERSSLVFPKNCTSPQEASDILNVLGSTLRSKSDPFYDVSVLPYPRPPHTFRGGISSFFPDKLYHMLQETEKNGQTDIVSFLPHGRAFVVSKPEKFVEEILPKYFQGQTKWGSFSRQLNLYGFQRAAAGKDAGCHYHELFLKGCPSLCRYMRRVGAPSGLDRRKYKLPEGSDPDFYSMPPINVEEP